MAISLCRRVPLLVDSSIAIYEASKQLIIRSHQLAAADSSHEFVSSICHSLRKGMNWKALSEKYHLVDMNSATVEKVLLEFKEPKDAKRALSFFHWAANNKGCEHGIRPYCITVHILSNARLINDARALLESIISKHGGKNDDDGCCRFVIVDGLLSTYKIANSLPFVFDLLVQCYSKLRMFETAFDVCCYLEEHGFSLSIISFNTLLHVMQKSSGETNSMVWKVYRHMLQKRVYPNDVTARIMIRALCKEGQLQKVVGSLDRIHGKRCSPVVVVNTGLVLRMFGEGRIEEGMVLLKRMLQKHLILDTIFFSLIVCAKVRNGELDSAREVYEETLKRGLCPNSFVHSLFIGAYCEHGMIEVAGDLMQEMTNIGLRPYDETFDHLIVGCAKIGKLEDGMRFCEEMTKSGLVPSCSAFNVLVGRLCEAGNVKQGNHLLTLLIDKGFSPDEITYSYLIEGYGREGNMQEALKLYYEMEYRSLSPGLPIFTALIKIFCKCQKPEAADRYLAMMKTRSLEVNASIYEALIAKHFEEGNKERAHLLYDEMVNSGLKTSLSMV